MSGPFRVVPTDQHPGHGRNNQALAEAAEQADGDLTEDGLARWFVRTYGGYRRVHDRNKWLKWDGSRWRYDSTAAIFADIRAFLRTRSRNDAPDEPTRKRLRSAQTVAAVERLCQSERAWATTSDQWDADPWVLCTPGGVINLRTGSLTPSDPTQLHTKQTAVTPAGECPKFIEFLRVITDGDDEFVAFLQRFFGLTLTGSIREHMLAVGYGNGRNGKGVLTTVIAGMLGDYAQTAPMETFTETRGERHPTDLAGLAGARLVIASETEEGRQWNASRIKALTGGDKISARFMRGDFFEFQPTFKLFVTGNHRPRLRSVDEAMRARLLLIPFTVTIPPERRDPDLAEKLRQEWPGILNWALAGCLDYQSRGLAPPSRVREATASYFGVQDTFGAWLDESCERGKPTSGIRPRSCLRAGSGTPRALGNRSGGRLSSPTAWSRPASLRVGMAVADFGRVSPLNPVTRGRNDNHDNLLHFIRMCARARTS
ncbi:MAG: phage/plasmid primase, P4 family [Gammaproteobacteria bacterium]